ncbi:MAG TPA: hypothetical protein DC057_04140 [Spirochaetia bacterium]|nr:hypothetical protein [Spirochaetia bacterium]
MIKNITGIFFMFLILSCTGKSSASPAEKKQLPARVENLSVPSGFDNQYAQNIKSGKPVHFTKPMLRIMNFTIPARFTEAINDKTFKMDDILKSDLASTGRYIILGTEDDIMAAIKEQNKIGYDEFKDDGSVTMGELKIAGYTLTGSIAESYPIVNQIGGHFSLKVAVSASITITNVNTGVIEFTKTIKSEKEELLFVSADGVIIKGPRNLTDKPINSINATGKDIDLGPQYRDALRNSVADIIAVIEERFPLMGEVIAINDNSVITTISLEHGIKEVDYLFIVRLGDELKDSSGKTLGFNKQVIGASQVTSVENGMSNSKIVKLKDTSLGIVKGDIVISMPSGYAN